MKTHVLVLLLAISVMAQTRKIDSPTFTGNVDASGAASTKPHKVASSAPVSCSEGETYYNSTVDTVFTCTATDTWTEVGPPDDPTMAGASIRREIGANGDNAVYQIASDAMSADVCAEDPDGSVLPTASAKIEQWTTETVVKAIKLKDGSTVNVTCYKKQLVDMPAGGGGTPNPPGYLTISGTDYVLPSMFAASKPTALTLQPYAAPTITTHSNGSKTFAIGDGIAAVEQAFTTQTTFTAAFSPFMRTTTAGGSMAGITLRQSGGMGAFCGIEQDSYDPFATKTSFWRLNSSNPPGWAADYTSTRYSVMPGVVWMRYVSGGGLVKCQYSPDGAAWTDLGSYDIAAWSMESVNRAGVILSRASVHVLYWKAE